MTRFLALALALLSGSAWAAEVNVAVASNFTAPMRRISQAFEQGTGHKAVLSFGSTGTFHAQIRSGAPFHVFLAADEETPARLEREGLAVAGSRFTYATGRLVLWSTRPGFIDGNGEVLRKGAFDRIAIANPKLAPYGSAALEVMEKLGVAVALQAKVVQGENISQAYQFVATGNAQLGFIAMSQVSLEGRITVGSGWVVPANLHSPIRQDAVLLSSGKDNAAATALLVFLKGEKARTIMRSHGYKP